MSTRPPATPLSEEAAPDPTHHIVRRTLCVNISGSLANLAMAGPQAAVWKPVGGREGAVFSPHMDSEADPVACANSLRAIHLVKATLQEHSSTFPCALGVSISCVPPNEVTDLGEKYAYTVLPHSRLSSPQQFYHEQGGDHETASWRQLYSQWNPSNLETEGVMEVNNQPFCFVNMRHPVIGLLRHNAEMIGCNIDSQPVIDGEWYKLTRQVLSTCCTTLRSKVLSKVLTHDFNTFAVQLHRIDANSWDDLGNGVVALQSFATSPTWNQEEADLHKEHHLRAFVTSPYQYNARIELEYKVQAAV
jgi:hypothetical protein